MADTFGVPVVTNSLGMHLAMIPAGAFRMGSPESETSRNAAEGPAHDVAISRPFFLGVHQVTQQQFQSVLGVNLSNFGPSGRAAMHGMDVGAFPVEGVSWDDAVAFCNQLSTWPEEVRNGRVYRLPTEAEWEYACRAGTRTPFSHGDSLSAQDANFNSGLPYGRVGRTPPLDRPAWVGCYPPNRFGLYDMHGNVCEWCADWYDAGYYSRSPQQDPKGPAGGVRRVARGGAWLFSGGMCRSAHRAAFPPRLRYAGIGFRVAADAR